MTIEEAYTIYKNCHKKPHDIYEPCPLAKEGQLESICNLVGQLEFELSQIEDGE